MTASNTQSMYKVAEEDDQLIVTFHREKWGKEKRMNYAMQWPEELKLSRPLTKDELASIGWNEMKDKPVVMQGKVGKEKVAFPFARYLSPQVVEQAGGSLLSNLVRIRRIVCDPFFLQFMQNAHPDPEFAKKRGTTYDLLFTVEPGHRADGIHLSKISKSEDEGKEMLRELNQLCAEAYMESIEASGMKCDNTDRWIFQASITAGHHDNHDFTSSQLNIAPITATIGGALKKKGIEHVDKNDDPTRSTVLFFLSNLPDNYFQGRMNIYSVRMTCPAEIFGILVFTGRHPHSATGVGTYPEDFPVAQYTCNTSKLSRPPPPLPADWPKLRASMPCYPKMDLCHPGDNKVHRELWGDQAIKAFGTQRNHQEWKLRIEVKQNRENIHFDVDELIERFSWINDCGEKEYPRKWIAEKAVTGWKDFDDSEYKKLHAAALSVDCGVWMPWQKEEQRQKKAKKAAEKKMEEAVDANGKGI